VPARSELMTLQEAADRLGVHYMTAYRYVRTGRLPAKREGVQWVVDGRDLAKIRAPGRPGRRSGRARSERATRLVARMVAGDEAGAWAVVESALASGAEPAEVDLDILAPALRQIGDQWAAGQLTVADEHRAAAIAQRLVGRLGPRLARRGRTRGTIVIGAPAGERHALPSAIVSDLLRGEGFTVLDLGADTPAASFVESCAAAERLVSVVVGVTVPGQDAVLRSTVRALRKSGVEVPILIGGAGTGGEDHVRALGADAWSGLDGRAAVATVEAAIEKARG